ncbi:MAG: sugar ABC transporter ATP-binding protein [Candidatus Nanopelagicaceae bacterium]
MANLLEIKSMAKSYGPVVALKNANFTVAPGEIHALMGANGAGKSTLVKILTGVITGDSGSIKLNGNEVKFSSPDNARKNGVAPVFQDPALIPDLSLKRNLRLTNTDIGKFQEKINHLGIKVNLDEQVSRIELPILRMIDLARALAHDPRLLILDEITAALPANLAEVVIRTMNEEKARGNSIIFISHRLSEISEICDRVTVLRDGVDVDAFNTSEGDEDRIVSAMLGTKISLTASGSRNKLSKSKPILTVRGIKDGDKLEDINFEIYPGEVLGVVALEGQGQDSLFEILAGEIPAKSGEIFYEDTKVNFSHPADAIRLGISYVPGDRKSALLPQRSIRENLALTKFRKLRSWNWIKQKHEDSMVDNAVSNLEIDTRASSQVKRLSGGNQQKVTIGRWITTGFNLLLCFDPTRGIDVGTKNQIYKLLSGLSAEGKSVLLFTSELREIQLVCDRAIVLHKGKVHGIFEAAKADEELLLNAAYGRN